MVYFIIILYSILSALGMVFMKLGSDNAIVNKKKEGFLIFINYKMFVGMLMYFLSFIFWVLILKLFPVVYISPIVYGINFIFIVIFSYLILKEKVTGKGILGAIIIIIGVIITSIN